MTYIKTDIPEPGIVELLFYKGTTGKVQISGKEVNPDIIEQAKKVGASDEDIHDTVLIASAFCMYNRYVDGLNTNLPLNN